MSVTKSTQIVRGGLSNLEARVLSTLAADGKSIICLHDMQHASGMSYDHAKVMAGRLRQKAWLTPIARGKYLITPLQAGAEPMYTEHEFIVATALAGKKPCYIAFWNALNHYGYTDQVPMTVSVVSTSRIANTRVHGIRYKFFTVKNERFFGTRNLFIGGSRVLISDKEKTLVDALGYPWHCGGIAEVAQCLWNAKDDVSFEKVVDYAKRAGNSAAVKRLGYLVETLGIDLPDAIHERMHGMLCKGWPVLDPPYAGSGKIDSKWKLVVNRHASLILEAKSET